MGKEAGLKGGIMENIMSMSLEDRAKIAKNLLDVLLCAMQGDDKSGTQPFKTRSMWRVN